MWFAAGFGDWRDGGLGGWDLGDPRPQSREKCGGLRFAEADDRRVWNFRSDHTRDFSLAPAAEGDADGFVRDFKRGRGAAVSSRHSEFEAGALGAADLLGSGDTTACGSIVCRHGGGV